MFTEWVHPMSAIPPARSTLPGWKHPHGYRVAGTAFYSFNLVLFLDFTHGNVKKHQ